MKKITTLSIFLFMALFAATYAASCHCGPPSPSLPPEVGKGVGHPSHSGGGVGGGVATTSRALITTAGNVTTDADFLSGNTGYGQQEGASISAGSLRKSVGLNSHGIPNKGPEKFGWMSTTSLPSKRSNHASVVHNGLIYTLGGTNDQGNPTNDVSASVLNADGSVRTNIGMGTFPGARSGHAAVIHNNYLYITGGNSASGDDVHFAKIQDDGLLGTWSATTSLPSGGGRMFHTAAANNGWLYVIGGSWSTPNNDILKAKINPDGTLGSWNTAGTFTTGRYHHGSGIYMGWLYVIGGTNAGGTPLADVQIATINPDGNIGGFTDTASLPDTMSQMGCVVSNGQIHLVGGVVGGPWSEDVYVATPSGTNGTVPSWTKVTLATSLTGGRGNFSAVAYNNYLYAIAGINPGVGVVSDVTYLPMLGSGATWRSLTALPLPRDKHAGVTNGNQLYLLGGRLSSTPTNEVRHAAVNTTGLASWTVDTTPGWAARYGLGAAVYNGYIYVAGGRDDGGNYYKDVWRAPLNADNSVGTWTQSADFDTAGRASPAVAAVAGYLYVFGGADSGGTHLDTVRFASIAADGSLGNWSTTTAITVGGSGRSSMGIAVRGNTVYLLAGRGGPSGWRNDVLYGTVNAATGQIPTWNTGAYLSGPGVEGVGSVIVNDYLYFFGGYTGSAEVNEIQYSALNTDGSIIAWSPMSEKMSAAKAFFSANTHNGYLFLIGGSGGGASLNTVETTAFNANGTAGEWRQAANLSTPRDGGRAAVYDGYLYMTGGKRDAATHLDSTEFATIKNDGSVTAWAPASAANFTTPRAGHAALVSNGYLYIIGGESNGGSSWQDDVQFAKININDGTLGTWATTKSFSQKRAWHAAAAFNGYLYILGGWTGSSNLNDVQYAKINPADGTLSTWATTTPFTTARQALSAAVFNGYLYVLGGWSGTADQNDVQFAKINADGTIGAWTPTTPFVDARFSFTTAVYNGYLFVYSGIRTPTGATAGVQSAPFNPDGTLGSWSATTPVPSARYGAGATAYNKYLYLLGGTTGVGDFRAETYVAPIIVQPTTQTSRYSKQFDLGADVAVNSIAFDGTIEGSSFIFQYRTAVSGSSYTSWSANQSLASLPGSIGLGQTVRYVELTMTPAGPASARWPNVLTQISLDTPLLPNGGYCQVAGDCANGICVSGSCCATACNTPGECQEAGTCAGGTCTYPGKPAGTACTDTAPGDCWKAGCVAGGVCDQHSEFQAQGHVCRAVVAGDVCDIEDVCDGASGTCVDGIYGINAKVCRTAGGECENDVYCDGNAKTCPTAINPKIGTPCTSDGKSCTDDICDSTGTGTCVHPTMPGFCLIYGNCFADGAVNAANQCEVCDSTKSQKWWSLKAGACDDAAACTSGDACNAGTAGRCQDGTTPCWNAADCPTPNPVCTGVLPNACRGTAYSCPTPKECEASSTCNGNGGCTVVNANRGTPCTADSLACTNDQCDGAGKCEHTLQAGGCLINGVCFGGGVSNPNNSCQFCAGASPNAWTNFPAGNDCNDKDPCTKTDKCDSQGVCKGTFDITSPGCQCTSDTQCTVPGATHCNKTLGQCVECMADAHCGVGEVCNMVAHKCRAEILDGGTDAGGDAGGGDAGTDGGAKDGGADAGGGCAQNPTICQGTATPICDTANDRCVECLGSTECALKDSRRPICRPGTNTCVECLVSASCKPGQTCDATGTCVGQAADGGTDAGAGCNIDQQCSDDAFPVCDTATHRCVQCLENGDCTDAQRSICDTDAHECVGCLVDTDCDDGYYCDANNTCAAKPQADGGVPAGEDAGPAAEDAGSGETLNPYGCACSTLSL